MQTASDIIEALGGTSAVAKELSLTPSTVSSWKSAGNIPKWRFPAVALLAKRRGVSIDADKIVPKRNARQSATMDNIRKDSIGGEA